jgi:hypothetical protein
MSFYHRQARQGNVVLLCHWCNAMKSGVPREVWLSAVALVNDSAAIQRRSLSPGEGTELTEVDRRECLREAVSRYRARQKALAAIKPE